MGHRLLEGGFVSAYLEEYLKSYWSVSGTFADLLQSSDETSRSWGAAVVLATNVLILPRSSEKDLRQTLTMSLEHVQMFLQLLAKGYTLELTDEEAAVRDHLVQSIRADFGLLSQVCYPLLSIT